MDKILAFSILSSSPADITGAGYATRLSWRSRSWQQLEKATEKLRQEEKVDQVSPPQIKREVRFAPEFDGINCFESMISF
ncbi:hypothetical protein CFC21_095703 [Triticum aestivum]|uniref:Uncharacterized protein n=2 Tax=Triticum aestivum TaxID=4565 RepID=A0A9R1MXP6_WHEAT|nr:hypothetical protein CFC21_095701 [Triticum aestivum]KAF7093281.1 hypothetical protein CFC21_095703 [Triticum aestivum]